MIDLSTAKGRSRAAANVSLSFVALAFLAPMVWVVLAAFDPVASLSIKMPAQWSLGNFGSIMTENTTIRPFINSLIISAGTSAVVVVQPMSQCATARSAR